jgi:hypothetical protein
MEGNEMTNMLEDVEALADPNNAAAAYMKLQGDVKQLIKETLIEILGRYDHEIVKKIQDVTLGHPAFDIRVKQVITNQMQR